MLIVKPCKSGIETQVIPRENLDIDLMEFAERGGFKVSIKTPYLLMLEVERTQVTLYRSGRMLVRTKDEEKAKKVGELVLRAAKRFTRSR